jgi:acyl dehydratase
VVAVAPRRAGAYVLTRYETRDARGERVSTTDYGSVYLGVACEPEGSPPSRPSGRAQGEGAFVPQWTDEVSIAATLAHVYSECARIWNPIHTDPAVARRAGLPAIILHGTATLALSVSAALRHAARGPATPVRRLGGRFTGMVPMPSRLHVEGATAGAGAPPGAVWVRATTPDRRTALDAWIEPA